MTTAPGPVTRASYAFTLNAAGQMATEASTITGDPTNGTTTYTYDALARLTAYTRSGTTTAYGWQATPNRSSVQVGGAAATTYTFDDANRVTADSTGGTYTADADGRLTSRPAQRLVWDSLGRLTKVLPATGAGTLATYTYDPLDRLRLADDGTTRTRFRYVGQTTAIAQTVNDQNGVVIVSIGNDWTGEHRLDWTGTGSNVHFYGTNAHHDLTWTADATGAVSATLRYDPWGTLTSSTGSSLPPFRFQGSWADPATNLSWVITRWYAPALGTFISEDSLTGDPADPPSRHLYAYGVGDPVLRIDLNGMSATRSYVIQNRGRFRGQLVLSNFIAAASNNVVGWPNFGLLKLYGDNRGYAAWIPSATRSRFLLKIRFSGLTASAEVHETCGELVPGLPGCTNAFPVVTTAPMAQVCVRGICAWGIDQRHNLITITESANGTINVRWSVTQSMLPVIRPDFTVEGWMKILPGSLFWDDLPRIEYHGEGFPSEELYWFDSCVRTGCSLRRTIFQRRGESFVDMGSGGDWARRYLLPQR